MSLASKLGMVNNDSKQPTMSQISPRQPVDGSYPLFLNVGPDGISPLRENCSENLESVFVDLKPPAENKLQRDNPELYQRRVLSDKACNSSQSSPRSSLLQSESSAESFKSPLPTDTSSSDGSNYILTPPPDVPRSMAVSSKRVGNDVRREHTKRRRPSPRVPKSGVNLWADTCSQASTDTEDDDFEFLFSNSQNPDRTRQYWELCYGKGSAAAFCPDQSWSAKRVAPVKGCLSHEEESPPTPTEQFKTPPSSPKRKPRCNENNKKVKFGLSMAVEYEIDDPSGCLTVLPPDVAKARYPIGEKEETPVEEEMTQETKKNSALLAEWEEDFDEPKQRSRRNRKNRRSSSVFKPTPIKTSEEDTRPDINEMILPSPSSEVAASLASLSMKSPNVALQNDPKYCDKKVAPSGIDNETPVMPQENDVKSRPAIQNEVGVGVSMDITPPQRAVMDEIFSHTDTTPPPSNLGLGTIHSVGGALDIDSPASGKQVTSHSPPSTMMNLCYSGEQSSTKVNDKEEASYERIDIARTLLRNPAADQEWSAADLLQNMALRNEQGVESILLSIDPKQKELISIVNKFVATANEMAEAMPKPNVKTEAEARRIVGDEWLKLETAFISQLDRGLESTLGDTGSLLMKAKALQEIIPKATKRARQQSLIQSYNREIRELERKVVREQQSLDLLEASLAPDAAVGCQATQAVMGFRFDEFNGEFLQLSVGHVVAGTESTVIFDLTQGSFRVQRTSGIESKMQSIPSDHVAAKLHHHMLKLFSEGDLPRFDASNLAELQDVIASVTQQLGEIDSMVAGLYAIAKDNSILVNADMPSLEIELPNGDCIVLQFGKSASLVPQHFTLFPGDGGTATRNRMPDDVTSHNLFQKLLQLCKT